MWGSSAAFKKFKQSMNVGYMQWHDGVGYDLEALDRLVGKEREQIEKELTSRATKDWRDLEALQRLDTPKAMHAIVMARHAPSPEIRLYAHRYGPPPTDAEWESVIVYGLEHAKSFPDGLMLIINSAVEHPSPGVREALWKLVRTPGREGAYHAAEALCRIAGIAHEDDVQRALFLRFSGPASSSRDEAVLELERWLDHR